MPLYFSTKTYLPGFSCAFRQWRADSHCNKLHGYAIIPKITFACMSLDDRNWCVDFGAMKSLKAEIEDQFDHKTLIAADDPALTSFTQLHEGDLIDLRTMPAVGCEAFARHIFELADDFLIENNLKPRVFVHEVEVSEHGGNSASYMNLPENI